MSRSLSRTQDIDIYPSISTQKLQRDPSNDKVERSSYKKKGWETSVCAGIPSGGGMWDKRNALDKAAGSDDKSPGGGGKEARNDNSDKQKYSGVYM